MFSCNIIFNHKTCKKISQNDGYVLFTCHRQNDIYKINLFNLEKQDARCPMSINEKKKLIWHNKLSYANFKLISIFLFLRGPILIIITKKIENRKLKIKFS